MSLLANAAVIILQKAGHPIYLRKLAESMEVELKILHEKLMADPRVRVALPKTRSIDQAKVILVAERA